MRSMIYRCLAGACLLAISSAFAHAAPNLAQGVEVCAAEFQKSDAARTGCTVTSAALHGTICAFGADCLKQDGSSQHNSESTKLTNMPLFRNCNGRLGFVCN